MNLEEFRKVRRDLIIAVGKFPKDKMEKIFYGDWTINEVVGHICAWDKYFSDLLINFSKGKDVEYWGSINEFNQREVTKRKDLSFEELKKELEETGNSFIDVFTSLRRDLMAKTIWKGRGYTPLSILRIQIHHYQSQNRQILKFLKIN